MTGGRVRDEVVVVKRKERLINYLNNHYQLILIVQVVEVLLILYRRTMYSFHHVTKNSEIILIDGRPPLSSQLRSLTALLAKNTGSVRYFLFVGDTGLYKIPNSVAYQK